jgi:hypothetical protein
MHFATNHLASPLHQRPSLYALECRIADSLGFYIGGTPAGFSSTLFRMALKARRQGNDPADLLSLLSHREMSYLWGFAKLCTTQARIFDGSLIFREQKVYMIPTAQQTPVPWYGAVGICRHVAVMEMSDLEWWGIRVPRGEEIVGFENPEGLISCQYCRTEFRIDFRSYGKAGNAMFVTRWMDYGDGAEEDDYRRRVRYGRGEYDEVVEYQRGSICAGFEGTSDFRFDETLTLEDVEKLCRKSPWPWPDAEKDVPYGRPRYMVRDGRIVPTY